MNVSSLNIDSLDYAAYCSEVGIDGNKRPEVSNYLITHVFPFCKFASLSESAHKLNSASLLFLICRLK
ncbi:hypothetical protein TNCV_2670141 [Trichonephila clavipes]|nr:hypothetical protein TNCV_2670141 [Trichonephila clavipes]